MFKFTNEPDANLSNFLKSLNTQNKYYILENYHNIKDALIEFNDSDASDANIYFNDMRKQERIINKIFLKSNNTI